MTTGGRIGEQTALPDALPNALPVYPEHPPGCWRAGFALEIAGVDHLVPDDPEEIFPSFLRGLKNGCAKAMYRELRKPDVTFASIPRRNDH